MNKRQAFYKVCDYEDFLESKLAPNCPKKNKETLEKYLKRYEDAEENEETLKIENLLNSKDYMRAFMTLYPNLNTRELEEKLQKRITFRKIQKYLTV